MRPARGPGPLSSPPLTVVTCCPFAACKRGLRMRKRHRNGNTVGKHEPSPCAICAAIGLGTGCRILGDRMPKSQGYSHGCLLQPWPSMAADKGKLLPSAPGCNPSAFLPLYTPPCSYKYPPHQDARVHAPDSTLHARNKECNLVQVWRPFRAWPTERPD